jgi:glyoxylase-like metal-dependent hydrolase (beta-lactamase superfamily II)/rhodanese-related sulfurtransferase
VILEQLYLGCLSQASYLIGDEASGVAAVVDPRRDIQVYLDEAEKRGLTIKHVLLTHFHADFLAGHLELQARAGATIYLGSAAKAEYDFTPLADEAVLDLGGADGVRLKVLETPGHTPESISILVYEKTSDEDPHAVLTGDTLFIGDVGRPDLLASVGVTKEELASMLYDSLHQKLLPLPDATIVYPGHGAGSACGKALSKETSSTLGVQRKLNYALQPMEKDAFVALVSAGQPSAPAYFAYDATLNKQAHPTLEEAKTSALKALSLEEAKAAQGEGAQLLDVRDPEAFAAGHLAGAVNVGLGGRFAGWAGAVLDPQRPIVVIAPPGKEEEAITRLGRIGFDRVAGYLNGGSPAGAEGLVRVGRLQPAELAAELEGDAPPHVLDVRGAGEVAEGAIDGSQHICLTQLAARVGEVPTDRPVVAICGGGYRSMVAASLLAPAGVQVRDVVGGMRAWNALHAPAG